MPVDDQLLQKREFDSLCEYGKAIGILLVIYGHSGTIFGKELILLFHVHTFFVISGILCSKSRWFTGQTDLWGFVAVKCKSFLLEYYKWGIILFLVYLALPQKTDTIMQNLTEYILGYRRISEGVCFTGTLWFLTALFSCQIVFYIIEKCISNDILKGASLASVIGIAFLTRTSKVILPFNADTVPFTLPLFAVGFYSGKYGLYDRYKKKKCMPYLIPACIVILYMEEKMMFQRSDIYYREFNDPVTFWICGLIGTMMVFEISKLLLKIKYSVVRKTISFIGANSMKYMAIHQQIVIAPVVLSGLIKNNRISNSFIAFPLYLVLSSILVIISIKIEKVFER